MRGISVRPEVVGPHIGGDVGSPPSHRESLLRLAPAQLWGLNRTRDARVDLPQVRGGGKGGVCHKEWWKELGIFNFECLIFDLRCDCSRKVAKDAKVALLRS